MKNKIFSVAALFTFCLSALTAAEAKPYRLYKNPSPGQPVQFRDETGRSLYFGNYRSNILVSSPAGTVSADTAGNAPLIEVSEKTELTPDFWIEQSKVLTNTGTEVTVAPYGYAVSIYIPVHYEFQSHYPESAKDLPRDQYYWSTPGRIWYDKDMNYLQVGGKQPENAVFYRVVCPYGPANYNMTLKPKKKGKEFIVPPAPEQKLSLHPGEIVLDKSADLRERYAATELSRTIGMLTNTAGVPIVSVPSKTDGFHIYIGASSPFVQKHFAADLKKLKGKDGYALRKLGNDFAVFGATSRGTIHAMARFLETNTDFIWFRPDVRYGMSFTPRKELKFDKFVLETSSPAFPLRTWGGPGNNDFGNCHRWYTYNYTNLGYSVRNGIFNARHYRCKELGQFCSLGANFMALPFMIEEKPEHYPQVNGVRRYKNRSGQPCYSNPEVIRNSIKAVGILLKEIPEELDFFAYDYSDSWICCECDECMKPIQLPDGKTLAPKSSSAQADPWFRSTRTFMVGNLIAEEVNRLRPGLPTQMLAYIYTSANPAVKLNPNLKVLFASYDTGNMRFPLHDQMTRDWYGYAPESWGLRFKKWITENPASAGIYEYFFTAAPAMFADAFAENLRDMVKAKAGWRIYSQSQGDDSHKSIESFGTNAMMWDTNAMDQWIISRLMWNPDQKVEDLRADFLNRVYQNAAPEMAEYYRLFGKRWLDKNYKGFINCHTGASAVFYEYIQKAGIEKELFSLMKTAAEKTDSPAAKIHLERKMSTLKTMKDAAGRVEIPVVDELAADWKDPESPHWNRAAENSNFRLPLNSDWTKNQAKAQTKIQTACDAAYLYFRIMTDSPGTAELLNQAKEENPHITGDSVELRFKSSRDSTHLFAVSGDGSYADYKDWNYTWDSRWEVKFFRKDGKWGATGRIPMQSVRTKPDADVLYLYLRTAPDGEFSFSRSDKNRNMTYPCDHKNVYSPFIFAEDSLFRKELDAIPENHPGTQEKRIVSGEFPVAAGKPYTVTFKAKTTAVFFPVQHRMDASRKFAAMFPRWELAFKLKNGQEKVIAGRYKNISRLEMTEYTDQFFAPENAVSVSLRIRQPDGKFKADAVLDTDSIRVTELDMQGYLNLNWNFVCGEAYTGWESAMIDAGMRTVNGKSVMDSGYGICSAGFPLEAGKKYVINAKRTIRGGYHPIEVCFMDKDGKHLRWGSFSSDKEECTFQFIPPAGTTQGFLRVYSQYMESCGVKPAPAEEKK